MKCPVCGKVFDVLYPNLWRYRRDGRYICSYNCIRLIDKGEAGMERKITEEQKQEAVRIALDGGSPLAYLKECGSLNASAHWSLIKKKLMKNDPETYEQLAKVTGAKKPAEKAPVLKVDGALQIQTKAPEKVTVQPDDGFRICGVRGQLGSWHFEGKVMDYSGINGDELYMPVEDWKLFLKELRKAAAMLGVDLGE